MGGVNNLVTVSCRNHHELLVKGIWNSLRDARGLDFELRLGDGRSVLAHRLILEAFLPSIPPVPKEADASKRSESNQEALTASELDLNVLVEFLYTGKATLPEQQLDALLEAGEELELKSVVDAVSEVAGALGVKHDGETDGSVGRRRPRRYSSPKAVPEMTTKRLRQTPARARALAPTPTRKKEVVLTRKGKLNERAGISRRCRMQSEPVKKDNQDAAVYVAIPQDDSECEGEATAAESSDDGTSDDCPVDLRKRRKAKGRAAKKEKREFSCQHCNYVTRSGTCLQVHTAKHDPSIAIFRCLSCSRKFLSEAAVARHKQLAHAGDPEFFECPSCDYKCRNKSWYQVHLSKHDASVPVFRCELCNKPFFSSDSLARHKLKHRTYVCPHCSGFQTPKAVSYYQHLFTVHEVDGKGRPLPRLGCPECTFSCKKASEMTYHALAKHSGTKPFKCPQCPYSTGRKTQVNRHIKSAHLDVRPFMCETCGRRCLTASQLERHTRVHTGERPFKCHVCSLAFSHSGSLKSHARLHVIGAKPFVCHICGHAFNRRYHLKVHLKNVHKSPMDVTQAPEAPSVQQSFNF